MEPSMFADLVYFAGGLLGFGLFALSVTLAGRL
jgi:hypothetical protein